MIELPLAEPAHTRRALRCGSHRQLSPPVIVLGMHRSGTSILSRMLHACGLFIGRRVSRNYESPYFQRLNVELLARAGSDWTFPEAYLARAGEDAAFVRACREWAERELEASFAREFLGLRRTLWTKVPRWWGFKDPRTSLTMAVWGQVFPDARVLHILRHPLDVAISLRRREEQRRREGKAPLAASLDLEHNLRVWETYVTEARRQRAAGGRYLEFRYEDLIADARAGFERIVRFCGIEVAPRRLDEAAALAESGRTRRYEGDEYAPWRRALAALPAAVELGYA
jgi:hypothetical protein